VRVARLIGWIADAPDGFYAEEPVDLMLGDHSFGRLFLVRLVAGVFAVFFLTFLT
jgi:hypothetical protein